MGGGDVPYPLFRYSDQMLPRTDRGYADGEREALLALSRATSTAAGCHRPARNMWRRPTPGISPACTTPLRTVERVGECIEASGCELFSVAHHPAITLSKAQTQKHRPCFRGPWSKDREPPHLRKGPRDPDGGSARSSDRLPRERPVSSATLTYSFAQSISGD